MLYSIDSNKPITKPLHKDNYDRWRAGLSDDEFKAIWNELSIRIDGSEIETSSWIPGANWAGTVYEPIYESACNFDESASAKFFGLILWNVVAEHQEAWSFGRYRFDDRPIEGMTYFRINPPRE